MARFPEIAARLLTSVGLALLVASFLLVPGLASADPGGGGGTQSGSCADCAVGCINGGSCRDTYSCNPGVAGSTCTCDAAAVPYPCAQNCECKLGTGGSCSCGLK
jgi:hypothetical protein